MGRLRWSVIAGFAAVWSALLGSALAVSIARSRVDSMPAPAPDPHALPLDYADPELRGALQAHAEFNLRGGMPDLAGACADRERYQVIVTPGLADADFVAVTVDVSGATAVATTRQFRAGPNGAEYRWWTTSQEILDQAGIEAIRAAAAGLLLSQTPPAINDAYTDASEWTAETCLRGRYHFWRRRGPDSMGAGQADFLVFARALLAADGRAGRARPLR
jgi:hypothetical protein